MEIFSGSDKKLLLELARSAVARRLDIPVPDVPKSSQAGSLLDKNFGLFVTLKMDGKLRGCIGYPHGDYPIKESVKRAALSAAFDDVRFPPVTSDEFDLLEIEVSVLSEPEKISGWHEIKLHRHGIILSKAGRRALFLPQVATEYNWDLPTTLSHLCVKAGLDKNDWKDGAEFEVFEAQVITENRNE